MGNSQTESMSIMLKFFIVIPTTIVYIYISARALHIRRKWAGICALCEILLCLFALLTRLAPDTKTELAV